MKRLRPVLRLLRLTARLVTPITAPVPTLSHSVLTFPHALPSFASVHVKEAKAVLKAVDRLSLSKVRILRELMSVGFADIRRAARWNADSLMIIDSGLLDDDTAAAISEISMDKDGRPRIKLYDKLQALQMLARHMQLFRNSLEVSGVLTNDIDADSVRNALLGRIALIARRSAENDNAERDVGRGTDGAAVGLEVVGEAEPTGTTG